MKTTRNTDVETVLAPADWGTGTVYMEPVAAPSPSRLGAAVMRFAPGARTVWHTHPRGQTILVTDGVGRCQRRGGPIETVSAGDAINFGPGEEHWHGATSDCYVAFLDMQEADASGSPVTWGASVTDEQYAAAGRS
jgi:quercetin dioxygenase-like cupin family protein